MLHNLLFTICQYRKGESPILHSTTTSTTTENLFHLSNNGYIPKLGIGTKAISMFITSSRQIQGTVIVCSLRTFSLLCMQECMLSAEMSAAYTYTSGYKYNVSCQYVHMCEQEKILKAPKHPFSLPAKLFLVSVETELMNMIFFLASHSKVSVCALLN